MAGIVNTQRERPEGILGNHPLPKGVWEGNCSDGEMLVEEHATAICAEWIGNDTNTTDAVGNSK